MMNALSYRCVCIVFFILSGSTFSHSAGAFRIELSVIQRSDSEPTNKPNQVNVGIGDVAWSGFTRCITV